MELSLRLSAVAELVTEGNRLVDVGCDHGYLPVYLVEKKKIPGAIAADVGKGPLSRAEEHIRQSGLEAYIETRLSNGLQEIEKGEGDTLVIAGMGGPLMERILTEGRRALGGFRELILQPQSDVPHVRRFLSREGFSHHGGEDRPGRAGKFYFIIKAVPETGENSRVQENPWTEQDFLFGKSLLESRHPVPERISSERAYDPRQDPGQDSRGGQSGGKGRNKKKRSRGGKAAHTCRS